MHISGVTGVWPGEGRFLFAGVRFGFTRLRSFLNITAKLPKYCQRNHPKLQTLQNRAVI